MTPFEKGEARVAVTRKSAHHDEELIRAPSGGGAALARGINGNGFCDRFFELSRRYPLEPLAKIREHAVEDRRGRVAARERERHQAEHRAEAERRAREQVEQSLKETFERERDSLSAVGLSAADLAQAEQYAARERERMRQHRLAEEAAADEAGAARAEASEARRSLRHALGQATAVDRHRAHWLREREREAERNQEEAADELGANQRGRR